MARKKFPRTKRGFIRRPSLFSREVPRWFRAGFFCALPRNDTCATGRALDTRASDATRTEISTGLIVIEARRKAIPRAGAGMKEQGWRGGRTLSGHQDGGGILARSTEAAVLKRNERL